MCCKRCHVHFVNSAIYKLQQVKLESFCFLHFSSFFRSAKKYPPGPRDADLNIKKFSK